jgi:hypothetical protein
VAQLSAKQKRYADFHRKVFDRWTVATKVKPSLTCDGTGRMAGPCPICRVVTVVVEIRDRDPKPRLEVNDCDNGCPFIAIGEVLMA